MSEVLLCLCFSPLVTADLLQTTYMHIHEQSLWSVSGSTWVLPLTLWVTWVCLGTICMGAQRGKAAAPAFDPISRLHKGEFTPDETNQLQMYKLESVPGAHHAGMICVTGFHLMTERLEKPVTSCTHINVEMTRFSCGLWSLEVPGVSGSWVGTSRYFCQN